MVNVGDEYREDFSYSQEHINEFARLCGDTNPIHLDAAYAATTSFKKPIMHGMIGGSVISRVFGITFHGGGFIYVSQYMEFKRPMFVDTAYEIVVTVKEVNREKHIATISTEIFDKDSGKLCIGGQAQLLHKDKI
jgi:acyl dehydratase